MTDKRPTFSSKEAADFLEVSDQTIFRLFAAGTLEGYRVTMKRNGRIRLYRDSVEEYDRQRKSQPFPAKK